MRHRGSLHSPATTSPTTRRGELPQHGSSSQDPCVEVTP